MKLYAELCGAAVFDEATGNAVAYAPNQAKRVQNWFPGRDTPKDAKEIAAAGERWREVAKRYGWRVKA